MEQGLTNMRIGVESDLLKIESLIRMAEDSAKRLTASANMRQYLSAECDASRAAQKEAEQIVGGLVETCRVQQDLLQTKVDESLSIAEYVMANYGTPALSGSSMIKWSIINQYTQL